MNVSKNSRAAQAGYLHNEPAGVVAVDQKGGGGNLQETRLYTYADDATRTVHMQAIGEKSTQHSDVEFCKEFVNTHFRGGHGAP